MRAVSSHAGAFFEASISRDVTFALHTLMNSHEHPPTAIKNERSWIARTLIRHFIVLVIVLLPLEVRLQRENRSQDTGEAVEPEVSAGA